MPAKKPPGRRHNRHTTDLGLVKATATTPAPAPPPGWLKATTGAWDAFWGSPQAALVMEADHPAVVRLFEYRDELARSSTGFRRKRFVEGSHGQPRLNPLAEHVARLERLISPLEDRFGLTPLSRLRLGVTFGQARTSLDELMELDDTEGDEVDPRLTVIDAEAR